MSPSTLAISRKSFSSMQAREVVVVGEFVEEGLSWPRPDAVRANAAIRLFSPCSIRQGDRHE